MARITITLEGSIEEILPLLQKLSEARAEPQVADRAPEPVEPLAAVEPPPKEVPPSWTEQKVREVWEDLKPEARKILKEYAREPEGVAWEEIQQRLNLKARQIGGRLSSLGHTLRRHGYQQSYSYPVIQEDGRYRLDPVWQQTLSKL